MKFNCTEIGGVYLIEPSINQDNRGFFSRFFCQIEFNKLGLETVYVQANSSYSALSGTLRGMHYQNKPHEETKLIRCVKGSIFDVVVDIRKHSPTFGKYAAFELSDKNRSMVYVPKGCAHGFLTLEDNTEMMYLVSSFYSPKNENGFKFNDPAFNINWPSEPKVISERDNSFSQFILI